MKKQRTSFLKQSAPMFTMALFVLMLGCILLLVVLGSNIYGSIVSSREKNSDKRAGLSYITQRVRAAEENGAISIVDGPMGEALILAEVSAQTGCETRIYLYEGNIVEEYALSGTEFSPENAQVIAKTSRFNAKVDKDELLLMTGEGATYINLHIEEAFS